MSQEQPRRPRGDKPHGDPIKYGDVFPVQGELAGEAIAPRDAALMQSAESMVLGRTDKDGQADVMQSAAAYKERAGHVGLRGIGDAPADQGVAVAATGLPRRLVVTEYVAGQAVGQYVTTGPAGKTNRGRGQGRGKITIGEALEATGRAAGDKPVDRCDAAAIKAAETRATGLNEAIPSGLAAMAESAADVNARMTCDENKTKLGEILGNATAWLPTDKVATREDAEAVEEAEIRNSPDMEAQPGGVASAVATAAQLNQELR